MLALIVALYGIFNGSGDLRARVVRGSGRVHIEGTGTLHAEGSGTATVRGNGTVAATTGLEGTDYTTQVTITDYAGDVSVNANPREPGSGAKWRIGRKKVLYQGYGSISVTGTDFQFEIGPYGTGITLDANGTGTARLNGTGTYQTTSTTGSTSGAWTPTGTSVSY